MKPVLHVRGPSEAGPGERHEMLSAARRFEGEAGVEAADVVRVDVPARGAGEDGTGVVRSELEMMIPALQSGSLFGGRQAVEVVDAQLLLAAEAEILADLLIGLDGESVVVVLVSSGALPRRLAQAVAEVGDTVEIRKMRERDAASWLTKAARARHLKVHPEAASALVQRFGSDVAALDQALDQLAAAGGTITREAVLERFRNRPDEPMWHYVDALSAGDTGEALRRLADFLTHGHPLQLLGFLESDLRMRAAAAAAADPADLAARLGTSEQNYRVKKAWRQRGSASDSELQLALAALNRADRVLKSEPEETHRLTMERLTVALSRWYGRRGRRAG